jgi:hypothetical protein
LIKPLNFNVLHPYIERYLYAGDPTLGKTGLLVLVMERENEYGRGIDWAMPSRGYEA